MRHHHRQPDPSVQALHDIAAFWHHYWPLIVALVLAILILARPKPVKVKIHGEPSAIGGVARTMAPYWLEWAAFLLVLAGWTYVARWLHSPIAAAVIVAGLLLAWMISPLGAATRSCFYARGVRRKWTQAVIDSGAADPPPVNSRRPHSYAGPRVRAVKRVPLGDLLQVEAGRGGGIGDVERCTDRLREILHVREVRVTRDRQDSGRAEVLLVRDDPFHRAPPLAWPNLNNPRLSVWEDIPFGRDPNGRWQSIRLLGDVCTSVLMAGATRRGKSRGMALILATAALDPDCDIWLMDGKEVELSQWQPIAQHFAGKEGADAIALLERLQVVMQDRYTALTEDKRKKVRRGEYRPQILFIDEIAHYLSLADRDQANRIMDLIINIAAMGLGAGVACVIATQQPAANLHPRFTTLRANLEKRLAYGMMSQEGSRMTLGPDAASAGYSATSIQPEQRGVCWALADGSVPVLTQTCLLTEEDEKEIISRAIQLRMGDEIGAFLAPQEATVPPAPPEPRRPSPAPTPPPLEPPSAQQGEAQTGRRTPRAVADRERLLALLADGEVWTLKRLEAKPAMDAPRLQWKPELDALVEEGRVRRWLPVPFDENGKPKKAGRGNAWQIQLAGSGSVQDAPGEVPPL